MALPTFPTNAVGTSATNAAAVNPGIPTGAQAGDLLLCLIETANQTVPSMSAGWTLLANPGVGSAGSTAATRLTVYWKIHSGSESAPTVGDSGNHQTAQIIAIRGVDQTTPLGTPVTGTSSTASTSGSIPGLTTTGTDSLVLAMLATDVPDLAGTAGYSGWSNGNLANVTERMDVTSSSANGGGFGMASGEKASAGSVGATSVTIADTAVKAYVAVEVFSAASGQTVAVGQATETDTAQAVTISKIVPVGQATETDTAQAVTASSQPLVVPVGQALETDSAQAISVLRKWVEKGPTTSPSPRALAGFAYHSASGKYVLFGGLDANNNKLNDTWTLDPTTWTWTQESPAHSPSARSATQLVEYPPTGDLILHGGNGTSGDLNDTWAWDGTDWTQLFPTGSPPNGNAHAMAYRPASQKIVRYGGASVTPSQTWEFSGTAGSYAWVQKTTAHQPGYALDGGMMATDPDDGNVVWYGGEGIIVLSPIQVGRYDKAWKYDGSDWTELAGTTPGTRDYMGAASTDYGILIVTGRDGSNGNLKDTWLFRQSWAELDLPVDPDPRYAAMAASDGNNVVLFGGANTVTGVPRDDLWVFGISDVSTLVLGIAVSTETALPATPVKLVNVGQATETDSAFVVTPFVAGGGGQTISVGQALETETAQSITPFKIVSVAQAAETDTAFTLGIVKTVNVAQALETDTALTTSPYRVVVLGQAAETETAQPLTVIRTVQVAQALETDTAQPLQLVKLVAIGAATETSTAGAVTAARLVTVGQALETDSAQALVLVKSVPVGQALETDRAFPIVVVGSNPAGAAHARTYYVTRPGFYT